MKDFIKLKIAAGISVCMNENVIFIFYTLFYIFPYFLLKINRIWGVVISLILFLLPFLLYKNYFVFLSFLPVISWAALSFAYVIYRHFYSEDRNPRKQYLKEIMERKEYEKKELSLLKQTNSEISEMERKMFITYSMSKILSEALSIKEIYQPLSKFVSDYFGVHGVSLYIYDELESGEFKILCGENTNTGFVFQDLEKKAKDRNWFVDQGKFYFLFKENEKIIGILVIPSSEEKENIKSIAEDFMTEIYPGIKRLQLFNSIEVLSRIDGLTQVFRRGTFDSRIKEELNRAIAFKTTLGLMIVDIDHFKKINDIYGHQAGDIILKQVASILKDNVYETDFVARYGGEEFAIILPRAEFSGALRKAEYLREKVEKSRFSIGFQEISVTISIGIAHYPRDAQDVVGLINMADRALYKAKQTGRNRVVDISCQNSF